MKPLANLLAEANHFLLAKNWHAAKQRLQEAAQHANCPLDAILHLAEIEIANQEIDRAYARLNKLAAHPGAVGPIQEEIEFLLARAELAMNQIAPALQRALSLKQRLAVTPPPLFTLLGQLYERHEDGAAAIALYHEAVAVQPHHAPHHFALARALFRTDPMQQMQQAEQAIAAGLKLMPQYAEGWELSGHIQSRLNHFSTAVAHYRRAIELDPARLSAYKKLARLLIQHWQYEEAENCLDLLRQRAPDDRDALQWSGIVKEEQGKTAEALDMYETAIRQSQSRGDVPLQIILSHALALPPVYSDLDDLMQWRQRYQTGLDELEQNKIVFQTQADDLFHLQRSNFLLAYQGENDRELQQRYATLIGIAAEHAMPALRAPRSITFDGERKLRVGFYGSVFRNCTVGYYFEQWVTALPATRCERFVYYNGPVIDSLTQRVAARVEHFVHLQSDIRSVATRLAADQLDVLVYPEIGMDATTYVLSALRLAPVQCMGWGHPTTSGSEMIDYYVSCAAMEPADAATHYVEKLVLLPGLGTAYAKPAAVSFAQRADFALPEQGHLYFCPQSLFKIHPAMDALFADIIEADPQAVLVLFQSENRSVTEKLGQRLQRCFSARGIAARGQLKFLPRLEPAQFRRALSLADVVLDTVRWSGGNTSLDALACGVPIVTWPGNLMRSRQTAAMLGLMQLDGLVVDSAPAYMKTSVEVATNKDLNHQYRQLIAERHMQVFNCTKAISAWGNALFTMATGLLKCR